MFENELMLKKSVEGIVACAEKAIADTLTGAQLIMGAQSDMRETVNQYACVLPDNKSLFYRWDDACKAEIRQTIERSAWSGIYNQSGIRGVLSVKAREQADRDLERGELPPLTVENVYAWIDEKRRSIGDMLADAVKEVFDYLRPHHSIYKTNKEYEIGEKVVMSGVVQGHYISSYREPYLIALSNVFLMLDGKEQQQYPNDFLTGFKDAIQRREAAYDTPYFSCKMFFGNGNLHIKFKRLDLVRALNQIAGGNALKHDNAASKQPAA